MIRSQLIQGMFICCLAFAGQSFAASQSGEKSVSIKVNNDSIKTELVEAPVADDTTDKDSISKVKLPTLAVTLNGLEDKIQRQNAELFLEVYAERAKTIRNPPYIRYLIKRGETQIKEALQPFGYYLTEVKTTFVENPSEWQVTYNVVLGKPVKVNELEIGLQGEGENHSEFVDLINDYPLKTGDVLEQEKYKSFKSKLQAAATMDGYFDADFARKQILMADDYQSADIHLSYQTGTRYAFGEITLTQDFLDQDVIDRYKTFQPGEPYSSASIADLQRDLYNSEYIKVIDVTAKPVKDKKVVPVDLKLTPKKNKKHTFGIGYGTDTGVRGKYDFHWRWVNRRGHSFKYKLFVSEKAVDTGVLYQVPGQHPATDNYQLFANYKQLLDESEQSSKLWNIGGAYRDQKGHLTREIGIKWQQEDFSIGNDSGNVGLLSPYVRLTYRKKDDPLTINDGTYVQGYFTATDDSLLSDLSLFQAIVNAKYIKRFKDVNRITVSGAAGKTWTKDFHQLPASYRFFTGGDRTIRGYRFESIGDRDSSGKVIGGDTMFYASAEYEYFFNDDMAVAAFVDAGDAYSADSADVKVGAGVGFHYYSPIGPIKVEIGHGFDKPGDTARLHLSIGPEF